MLPILVPAQFRIIAHRGASAYAPENTAAAFRLAHAMQVTEVELDAQLTADGRVVLCHDSTLVRYGHGSLVVEHLTWDDLSRLDMGSWFSPYLFRAEPMLLLDDLFSAYGDRFTYHVEIKGAAPTLPAVVHDLITRRRLAQSCVVTSFSLSALAAMRDLDAHLRLGMGSWFSPYLFRAEPMLLLDDLFSAYGDRFTYHVEIKGAAPTLPAVVHDLITCRRLAQSCVVTSFSLSALAAMRDLDAHLRLGWLVDTIAAHELAQARDLRLFQLCPAARSVTPQMVQAARSVVPEVRAWGIQGETAAHQAAEVQALIGRVLEAGCDGMTLNWPDWVTH